MDIMKFRMMALICLLVLGVAAQAGAWTYLVSQSTIASYGYGGYANGEAAQDTYTASGWVLQIDPNIGPSYSGTYDGPLSSGDDAVVVFLNNTTSPVASATLTGTGNGGGMFAFDGDDNFGYGVSSITGVDPAQDTGTINFTGGLQPGGMAWWAFESNPSPAYGGSYSTGTVPEPTSMLLLGLGLIGVAGIRRKFGK